MAMTVPTIRQCLCGRGVSSPQSVLNTAFTAREGSASFPVHQTFRTVYKTLTNVDLQMKLNTSLGLFDLNMENENLFPSVIVFVTNA